MATILKVQHGSDIRRLNITHFSTYAEFAQLVRTIFNISELSGLKLMYQDEDNDFINIRSDLDMDEARRYAAQLPSFKIHALLANGISSSPQSTEPAYPQLAPEDIGTHFSSQIFKSPFSAYYAQWRAPFRGSWLIKRICVRFIYLVLHET